MEKVIAGIIIAILTTVVFFNPTVVNASSESNSNEFILNYMENNSDRFFLAEFDINQDSSVDVFDLALLKRAKAPIEKINALQQYILDGDREKLARNWLYTPPLALYDLRKQTPDSIESILSDSEILYVKKYDSNSINVATLCQGVEYYLIMEEDSENYIGKKVLFENDSFVIYLCRNSEIFYMPQKRMKDMFVN